MPPESHRVEMGATVQPDGVTFRVWAPHAESAAVVGEFNRWSPWTHPMSRDDDGIWTAHIAGVRPGDVYRYWFTTPTGGLSRLDPYARAVTGVKGHSIVYDAWAFDWEGDAFQPPSLPEWVIYEMHIGSFAKGGTLAPGTFDDVLARLDHLKALGITAIELMPVAEFSGESSWGYNPVHLFAVSPRYGGPDGFKRFVRAVHRQGIAVVLDVVYNHLGPMDLDLWQYDGWDEQGRGGIYFYPDERAEMLFGPRPDYRRPQVRRLFLDNLRMWLDEYHVDGFRIDSTLYMRNARGDQGGELPEAWSLLQEMTELIRAHHPGAVAIAEDLQDDPRITQPVAEGGLGFSTQWTQLFVGAIREELSKEDGDRDLGLVRRVIEQSIGDDAFARVIYSESHDEDANGKVRVPEQVKQTSAEDWQAQKRSTLAAALLFTIPGVPMLFQGQEFLEGDVFRADVPPDWDRRHEFSGIVRLYRDLIDLRCNRHRTTAGLCGPHVQVDCQDDVRKLLAFRRWDQGGPGDEVVVVANFCRQPQENCLVGFPRPGRWRLRFNGDARAYSSDFGGYPSADVEAEPSPQDGLPASALISIGPYTLLVYGQEPS